MAVARRSRSKLNEIPRLRSEQAPQSPEIATLRQVGARNDRQDWGRVYRALTANLPKESSLFYAVLVGQPLNFLGCGVLGLEIAAQLSSAGNDNISAPSPLWAEVRGKFNSGPSRRHRTPRIRSIPRRPRCRWTSAPPCAPSLRRPG